ncbi:MAG: ferric reductase-like transmembrane domain-containing protein [Gaiellaceae bacterium]
MHLTSNPLDWYAARAAGVVAYLLLSFVVVLGTTMARKATLRRWPQFALEDVHRFAGLLVGAFVAIHVVTIAIDSWLPFSIASIAIPLLSLYRPVWVALGIVAAELLLALAVTNHYRRRLPYRFWRRAHYLNFAVWTAATLHGIGSGTDRSSPWLLAVYSLAVAAVTIAITVRLLRGCAPGLRIAGAAAVALAAVALSLGLALGPLRFHPKPWNARTFAGTLNGQVLRDLGVTRGIISMAGTSNGQQRALIRADLLIRPGRVEATTFQMEFLPSGLLCLGRVTKIHAYGFEASCRTGDGSRRYVRAHWQLSGGSQLQGGLISVHT